MKKLIFPLLITLLVIFTACDSTNDPVEPELEPETGQITIRSTPEGAAISSADELSNAVTPFSYANIEVGNYTFTLSLENYHDTTFTAEVEANTNTEVVIDMMPVLNAFGPIRIWETVGSTSDQPSGLNLSAGEALSVGNDTNKPVIDLYFSSEAQALVKSSHLHASALMVRETYFKVGENTNIFDGLDSEVKTSTWADTMKTDETNYHFILDNDGYYYKLVVSEKGSDNGVGWVDVTYLRNPILGSTKF